MSKRKIIQDELVAHLENNSRYKFNAPYGVLTSLDAVKSGGKVRRITFGVSRYLDATITIWSENKIQIAGSGGLAWKYQGDYNSKEDVIKALSQ